MFVIAALFFFHPISCSHELLLQAQHVLDLVPYELPFKSIIGKNEWKELQLDRLISVLDRTKTSCGQWGLKQLIKPIDNHRELLARQEIISFLVDHEDVLLFFQNQLSVINRSEKSLFAYWDDHDQLDSMCDQFYYTIPLLKKNLNRSVFALDVGTAITVMDAWKELLMSLCLYGAGQEFTNWLHTDQKGFDLLRGIKMGLAQPLREHSFELDLFKHKGVDASYDFKDYISALLHGTFGDRYHIFTKGYSYENSLTGLVSLPDFFQKVPGAANKSVAFLCAALQTISYDYTWGSRLVRVGKYIVSINNTLKRLQHRIVGMADCCRAIKSMQKKMSSEGDVFKRFCMLNSCSNDLEECFNVLSGKSFLNQQGFFYSPGRMLQANALVKHARFSLVSSLQSIAMLDAYCSIAQLYKESQKERVAFSFCEFIYSDQPVVAYSGSWLALLPYDEVVENDLFWGGERAGKTIITGPNGGGKSALLKTFGIAVVLAQSWGIIPAQSGRQTLFNGIRTGIAPRENLKQGLSTFMAEKKCMETLFCFMQKSRSDNRVLVLIDEPYQGTVESESSKRIYNFGKSVASFEHVLIGIATHVQKPIQLAVDTQGVFANYHLAIREKSVGIFERLFVVKEGPALWWFEDDDKRGRFTDWVGGES